MQITDYITEFSGKTFSIERNDIQWGEAKINDFFRFMAEYKAWFFDAEGMFLVIPDEEMKYDSNVKAFLCTTENVRVYTWESFCRNHSTSLTSFFTSFAEASDDIEWGDAEGGFDEDVQGDAYHDFRRDQAI